MGRARPGVARRRGRSVRRRPQRHRRHASASSTALPPRGSVRRPSCRPRCIVLPQGVRAGVLPPADRASTRPTAARNPASCARWTAAPSRSHDHAHKRRRDAIIEDAELIKEIAEARSSAASCRDRARCISSTPRAWSATSSPATRAEDKAHFRAHRDNTTKGTAHRRFAVSVNLNDDFEGGEVSFPEFSPRGYKPPVGGAVVFSCSLLHAVSQVTRGRRYAFLPFLYDDAAARIREAERQVLGGRARQRPQPAGGERPVKPSAQGPGDSYSDPVGRCGTRGTSPSARSRAGTSSSMTGRRAS